MSIPEVKDTLTGYEFSWETEQIIIAVSRLKEHNDGRVIGEINVTTTAEDYNTHLHQAQLNFSAGRTRKELAKTLQGRVPDLLTLAKWDDIVEQLCVKAIARLREGDPVELLQIDDRDIPRPEYLLEPILLQGTPTIIFGEKGVHKTTLAILFAICLILSWKDNPLGLVPVDRTIKTLILDWEQERNIVAYTAKQLRVGLDLPYVELSYRHCASPLANDLEQIRQHIYDCGAEVIIIDSLAAACGGELVKTEPANNFFAALRKLKVTSLILAQTSKEESKKKSIYGNAIFTYYARTIFEAVKAESVEPTRHDVALFNRHANYNSLRPPLGFHLNYNGTGISIESQSVSVDQFIEKYTTQQAILESLKSGAMKPKDLADKLEISESAVKMALSRLKKKGKVTPTEYGYGLLSKYLEE